MSPPAFVTSFTGNKTLSKNGSASLTQMTPRCAMASDSVAPVIKLKETDLERQNSVSISFEPISASLAAADAVTSNSALAATLQKKRYVATLPGTSTAAKLPAHVSAPDFYYPTSMRNLAPIICLDDAKKSLSVAYEVVKAEVAGVESTSAKEVPFWKQPKPSKWSNMATAAAGSPSETLSTELYEMYFPSSVRNVAPEIKIRAPEDCLFNELPYIQVGSEFVPFNPKINKMVTLPKRAPEDEIPLQAAATVLKYFPDDKMNMAPKIEIKGPCESIGVSMEAVCPDDKVVNDIYSGSQ